MTKIRSRDSRMIDDRRGQSSGRGGGGLGGMLGRSGGGGGGLGDILGGALGGGGGRGGGGMGGLKAGGGMIGILVLLATLFLPKLLGGASGQAASIGGGSTGASTETTGGDQDACSSEAEQILCGATIDVQEFWLEEFPKSFNQEYEVTTTVFFSGFTNTGCGQASAQTGPFYCPADHLVYFDLDFLAQLQSQCNAPGDLAAQYIVAHEYGHHIQNVLGINSEMRRLQERDKRNSNKYSVALELQADCLAGVWANDANSRNQFDNRAEIGEAINAAEAVGDDRIQQQTQGRVDKESWTHGSSAQRKEWFQRGFETGNPNNCNTFDEIANF
jgi:predicted metalloprotease